jgi:hypothetical protein
VNRRREKRNTVETDVRNLTQDEKKIEKKRNRDFSKNALRELNFYATARL